MFLKLIFGGIITLISVSVLQAQTGIMDTLIQIEDIEVRTSRLKNFVLGTSIDRIEPQVIQKNYSLFLTEIFASLTGMAIKSYGLGGLSTISIRGGGASHTAVMWNGFNIQNPMSGMANLSSIPAFLVSNISIQQGGSGTLYGSGAVGGVVHISSFENINEQNHVSFQVGYGSYNRQNLVFLAKTGDKMYAFSLKIYKQSATNDFTFRNIAKPDSPLERQTNAAMRNYGFMPDLQVITSKKSLLSFSALYQKYNKDIQTMMTNANPNTNNQSDDNLFMSASWKYISPKYSVNIKSGMIRNRIIMTDQSLPDPEEEPIAKNESSSLISEIESKIFIAENHILNAGINYTKEKGESTGYLQNASRGRISLFFSYKIINLYPDLNTVFSLRSEFEKGKIHPLTFSFGSDYSINKTFTIKGNISKNYKIPSFNDLFWKPDTYAKGNPDLKPESGYSGELGVNEKFVAGKVGLEFSQTAFATSIRDWIIWLPDGAGVWSPDNKEHGKTKGLELRGNGRFLKGNSKLDFNGFYTWTEARLTSDDEYNDKPMIYVPEHRLMASIDYSYKRFSVNFNFNYIGERYYDHIHTLPGYQLGNLAFIYDMPFKVSSIRAVFGINNIWNTKYQAMAWYAMPLRSYQLSLNLRINTKY